MTEFCDNSLIDQFKTSINKIYQNSIDIVELTSIARKFQINIASDEFSLQRGKESHPPYLLGRVITLLDKVSTVENKHVHKTSNYPGG